MGKPITTNSAGICFAFPNVLTTTIAGTPTPIPYPSIGQLSEAQDTAGTVFAGGDEVVTSNSSIETTTGDEPADANKGGPVDFTGFSESVKAEGFGVVRLTDQTKQNNGNAVGTVLGGFPTVLVGD